MSDYPSIGQQAKNLISTIGNVISNPYLASEEVRQERMRICQACEYYDAAAVRCKECGCFLNAKVIFTNNSCPVNKWSYVEQTKIEPEPVDVNEVKDLVAGVDYPAFPIDGGEIGEVYTWEDASWTWDGESWKFNYPPDYDGPREEDV